MEKKNYRVSLEGLALRKCPVLFDTSVLLNYLTKNKNSRTLAEKIAKIEEHYNFVSLMQNYIGKGSNFYITPLISEELQAGYNYSIKKNIKRMGFCRNRGLLKLHRKERESYKEQRKLVETFRDKNKILELREGEKIFYQIFYNRYIEFKEKYNLSEADFNFLISGMTLAKARCSVTLVSNDLGIFHARGDIWKEETRWPKKFKFFVRRDFLDFEKIGG
ncbi:hypothetical protein ES705_16917 [subsurface metagenome]